MRSVPFRSESAMTTHSDDHERDRFSRGYDRFIVSQRAFSMIAMMLSAFIAQCCCQNPSLPNGHPLATNLGRSQRNPYALAWFPVR